VPSCFETPHSAAELARVRSLCALRGVSAQGQERAVRVRRTKRASAGHDDLRWEGENQPVAVEKDACRGLPVSSLLFTGSCTTAARSSDTRLEIRADDPQGSGFASASHRTRPPLFGASKNGNLQVYKIVAVTHPLFPIVFINGKSNWSVWGGSRCAGPQDRSTDGKTM